MKPRTSIRRVLPVLMAASLAFCSACSLFPPPSAEKGDFSVPHLAAKKGFNLSQSELVLRSNAWVAKDGAITLQNPQSGELLPYGSKILPISSRLGEMLFKVQGKGDRVFRFLNDKGLGALRDREAVKLYFGNASAEQIEKAVSPEFLEAVRKARVVKGMTTADVLISWGRPPPHRTPDLKGDTWIYYVDSLRVRRVVFKEGKVSLILD